RRHEVLRTTFVTLDGQPVQVAHPAEAVTLPVFDLSADENPDRAVLEIISSERSQVQDLSRLPLMRFSLIRMSENEHWLVRVCHHIISEGWASRGVRKEPPLPY